MVIIAISSPPFSVRILRTYLEFSEQRYMVPNLIRSFVQYEHYDGACVNLEHSSQVTSPKKAQETYKKVICESTKHLVSYCGKCDGTFLDFFILKMEQKFQLCDSLTVTASCPDSSTPNLFELVRRLSIFKYLSYGEAPFSRSTTARLLPEVKPFMLHFKKEDLAIWKDRLRCHNALLARGMKVGSDREFKWMRAKAKSLQFDSVERFMLHAHPSTIADLLDALISFSDKVRLASRNHPLARAWYLRSHLLIRAGRWRCFRRRFRELLAYLTEQSTKPTQYVCDCPEQERLRAALRRATGSCCG